MLRDCYISELKQKIGQQVRIAGWVHELRDIGKIKFLILRDKTGIVQAIALKKQTDEKVYEKISVPKESVVQLIGTPKESNIAKSGFEFVIKDINVLNVVSEKLPVDPTDKVPSELETRLTYRYIDLRKQKIHAIFSIRSEIENSFRNLLLQKHFEEITPSSIVGAATEGGADLFEIKYFENKAYLAQSPQLYKQLAVIGGMDKVFMTTPVFRAEKHNTTTHLNEVLQMDIEMGFCNDSDAMDILEYVFLGILNNVKNNCAKELEILGVDLHVPKSIPRFSYTHIVDKLSENNITIEWGEDFSKDVETKIPQILGSELFFITDWPIMTRAFYSMPNSDGKTCKAFDLIYKGLEISSGAQRIHIPEILEQSLDRFGLDKNNFSFYTNAFKMGAPPHAGWSLGLERIVMKVCNLNNIREAVLFPRDRTRLTP